LKKTVHKINRIGLIGNSEKTSARSVIAEAARLVKRAGRTVYCAPVTARLANLTCPVYPDPV
jgi:hypothetical protein